MMDLLKEMDVTVLLWINNGLKSGWMDHVMLFCSGKLSWLPLYAVLLYALYRADPKKIWVNLIVVTCCIALADQVASSLLKPWVGRLRPCHDPIVSLKLILIKDICGGQYGFVSSHAANVFAVFFLFYKKNVFQKKIFVATMLIWAIVVSLSRVYLGVHYPGDVLGGAIVGILSTLLIVSIQQGIEKKIKANSVSN